VYVNGVSEAWRGGSRYLARRRARSTSAPLVGRAVEITSLGGPVRIFARVIVLGIIVLAVFKFRSAAAESPHIRIENGTGQLIVNGQPFLILGGELGNSSSGTAEQADAIVPRLRSMHVNTILMPVTWEQIEPKEGSFDFDILDHWVERAREQKMHLVLLWFGSWKNAFSSYAPSWVKSDAKRFPRAESADGRPLEILSTLSLETVGVTAGRLPP
jgi:hypothetical protein